MDSLFPVLPEDLSSLDREALTSLEAEHLSAQALIRSNDQEFLSGLNDLQIVEQATQGRAQLRSVREALAALTEAEANFTNLINDLTADAAQETEGDEGGDEGGEDEGESLTVDPQPELEPEIEETVEIESVVASVETALRRPPAPSRERQAVVPAEEPQGAVLTASVSADRIRVGDTLGPIDLAVMLRESARRLGAPKKHAQGTEERYMLASAAFRFPEERILTDNIAENSEKIRMLRNTEGDFLLASGGLCAPLTPIYSIPQFATALRPVRDALVSYMADRGGVNVPVPTTLASASDAITVITEADDTLGGTFATKSCLDQTCLSFVETAVTIISHCREYGNLNARAWPESIAFENELTMAEHARVAEGYLLARIKAQSIQVTAATVYSTAYDLIYAITRAVASMRFNLRMSPNARFRALIPTWVPDQMIVDIAATPFDRFVNRARVTQILRDAGVEPAFYLDDLHPLTGTSQGFPAEVTSSTLDDFPDVAQIGLFPEGAFIHVDGGVLELGLVRDSTLNSTNDFQFFGESFENVALLAPAQATRWVSATICPSGEFPATTTALTC